MARYSIIGQVKRPGQVIIPGYLTYLSTRYGELWSKAFIFLYPISVYYTYLILAL